jgi:hypothetical protein
MKLQSQVDVGHDSPRTESLDHGSVGSIVILQNQMRKLMIDKSEWWKREVEFVGGRGEVRTREDEWDRNQA